MLTNIELRAIEWSEATYADYRHGFDALRGRLPDGTRIIGVRVEM
ncbi:hypothetical protein [Arthrobacter sp. STN4]|nr:hypothetical protein [Arthrobacter sp. STN4]